MAGSRASVNDILASFLPARDIGEGQHQISPPGQTAASL